MAQIWNLKCGQPDCFEHVETEGDPQGVLQHPRPPGRHVTRVLVSQHQQHIVYLKGVITRRCYTTQ